MATYTMLRRVSRSLLPLAIRAVGAPRPFHGAISAVVNSEKGGRVTERNGASSVRFSTLMKTNSDEALVEVIDSEIQCAQEPDSITTMPEGFPFKIHDLPGESTVLLEREYRDETIKVRVDMPSRTEDEYDEEEEDDDKEESDREEPGNLMIPMVVTISKGSGSYLEFGLTAFPDEITIDSLSMRHPDASDEQLLYEGPEFNDLDKKLQKAIQKYLEVRGINANTGSLLSDYMNSKDNREYKTWLKNLKLFILQ